MPCNMTLYFLLNEDFLLMSSLPKCLVYSLDELSKRSEFLLMMTLDVIDLYAHVLLSSLPCKQLCMLSLCWQPFLICRVLVWPSSLPCKQLGVVHLFWQTFLVCWMLAWLLSVLHKQLGVDRCLDRLCDLKCLQCSPRASCYLEQGAGGSWLESFLIDVQA